MNGDAQTVIANNIFWHNEGADLRLGITFDENAHIRNNIIDIYHGSPPLSPSNISVDPQFDPSVDLLNTYRPKPTAPQVEAGTPLFSLLPFPIPFEFRWSVGPMDLRGFDRIQGRRVDIGAFEFPLVFRDSFE